MLNHGLNTVSFLLVYRRLQNVCDCNQGRRGHCVHHDLWLQKSPSSAVPNPQKPLLQPRVLLRVSAPEEHPEKCPVGPRGEFLFCSSVSQPKPRHCSGAVQRLVAHAVIPPPQALHIMVGLLNVTLGVLLIYFARFYWMPPLFPVWIGGIVSKDYFVSEPHWSFFDECASVSYCVDNFNWDVQKTFHAKFYSAVCNVLIREWTVLQNKMCIWGDITNVNSNVCHREPSGYTGWTHFKVSSVFKSTKIPRDSQSQSWRSASDQSIFTHQ